MNRIVTVLLCLLFFFNGAIAQLIKLPQLFAHFQEHRKSNPELELTDFVAMHYLFGDNNDADNERDDQLPFKKFNNSANFDVGVPFTKQRQDSIFRKEEFTRKSTFSYVPRVSVFFEEGELRPPAAC